MCIEVGALSIEQFEEFSQEAVASKLLDGPLSGVRPQQPPERRLFDEAAECVRDFRRPLGFDQVVELSGNRVTRAQVSAASAALCRGGQLDRIRAGVYQWSAGRRGARRVPLARQPDAAPAGPPGAQQESVSVAGLFGQMFPDGVQMTGELLADLEQ